MQSKWESHLEAITTTCIGFVIAVTVNYVVLGSMFTSIGLTIGLTITSYANKFLVRRFFNRREAKRGLDSGNQRTTHRQPECYGG